MPKIKDKGATYRKKYSEDDIQKAISAVRDGMSKKAASKKYGIPRTTIIFRLGENFKKKEMGPSPILTMQEEKDLVEWILYNHRRGFPRRKEDIQTSVKDFLDKSPRENPFRDNFPGEGWFKAFLKRHPILTERTSEPVTKASANVSETDIRKWFLTIETYLKEENYFEILNDTSRVYNGDETNFILCPKGHKVIAPRGAKNVYEVDSALAKSSLTVMFTFGANGDITPPMIIYPNKRRTSEISKGIPDNWGYGLSDNGWMKAECFYEYIANVLYPHLKSKNIQFPILLFVDGHSTHLTLKLSKLCTELEIVLIALYPNATRILQPADVAAFKPIKNGWKRGVMEWRRNNPSDSLTKEKFAPVLKIVIEKYLNSNIIINGFKSCGLCPWNVEAIDWTKCLGKSKEEKDKDKEDSDRILDFSTLKDILGKDIIEELQDNRYPSENKYLKCLERIWKHFQKESIIIQDDLRNNSFQNDSEINVINTEYTKIPDVGNEHEEKTSVEYITETHNIDLNITDEQFDTFDILNIPVVFEVSDYLGNPLNVANENLQETHKQSPQKMDLENLLHRTPVKNLPTCSMQIVPNENTDPNKNVSLKETLQWPVTPERKGKINKEKMPFVITSATWKEIKNRKLSEKKEKEKAAEERKRKRIESNEAKKMKFIEKAAKVGRKEKTKTMKINDKEKCDGPERKINIISSVLITPEEPSVSETGVECLEGFEENKYVISGLCFSCCNNVTKTYVGIKCYSCRRQYHKSCILKNNPLSERFTCHTCKKNSS